MSTLLSYTDGPSFYQSEVRGGRFPAAVLSCRAIEVRADGTTLCRAQFAHPVDDPRDAHLHALPTTCHACRGELADLPKKIQKLINRGAMWRVS